MKHVVLFVGYVFKNLKKDEIKSWFADEMIAFDSNKL